MSNKMNNLTAGDRVALRNRFNLSIDQVTIEMAENGMLVPSNIDVDSYEGAFDINADGETSVKSPTTNAGSTSITKPQTSTKKVPTPKKRARKGDKIKNAFAAVPTTPTPVLAFAQLHGVSVAVLRQAKRFSGTADTIRVKKDKASGNLMIWKETD